MTVPTIQVVSTPPLLVTDFDPLGMVDVDVTASVTGGGEAFARSSVKTTGKGIFKGRDSHHLYLEAGAANDFVQLEFNPQLPANSTRFMIRIWHDLPPQSAGYAENWSFRVFLGNTDLSDGVRTVNLINTTSHRAYETLVLARNDFTNTIGSGINWANPINACSIQLRKGGSAGTVECYLDAMYANWELVACPVFFSADDQDEPTAPGSYGQLGYLWTQVFEPRGWKFTIFATEALADQTDRLTTAEHILLHDEGNDICWHGEVHTSDGSGGDYRLTSEGGDYATQADMEASHDSWLAWSTSGGRDWTRPREAQHSATPFGNFSKTTLDSLMAKGWAYHRTATQGWVATEDPLGSQNNYLWFDNDAFTAGYNQEILTLNINQNFTAASMDAQVGQAVERQAGVCIYTHVFYDTPTSQRQAPKAEADLLWPLLDTRVSGGEITVHQITEVNEVFAATPGDGGALNRIEDRRPGPQRRRSW